MDRPGFEQNLATFFPKTITTFAATFPDIGKNPHLP
jgi:hypothetical protein